MGAEGTGRAHTNWKKVLFSQIKLCHVERSVAQSKHPPEGYLVKQAPKFINKCRGPVEELPIWERLMPRAASPVKV